MTPYLLPGETEYQRVQRLGVESAARMAAHVARADAFVGPRRPLPISAHSYSYAPGWQALV